MVLLPTANCQLPTLFWRLVGIDVARAAGRLDVSRTTGRLDVPRTARGLDVPRSACRLDRPGGHRRLHVARRALRLRELRRVRGRRDWRSRDHLCGRARLRRGVHDCRLRRRCCRCRCRSQCGRRTGLRDRRSVSSCHRHPALAGRDRGVRDHGRLRRLPIRTLRERDEWGVFRGQRSRDHQQQNEHLAHDGNGNRKKTAGLPARRSDHL